MGNLIIMDTMDILPTVDTMDGVDITDIPTDTGNVMLKLHPLPLPPQLLMLMPAPNLGTMDYGHPYRWGGYYRGYYGYGYPYRYWWKRSAEQQLPESQHIVKRSADADADADASPESYYYGYYGHPYRWGGYYRGYYGYGYPGYYWG